MKIIITGASGFVGLNLSKYLSEEGHEVLPLSLRSPNWEMDKTANAIIHLAGKAHDTKNTSAAAEYFEVNRDLTKQLFQQFLDSSIQDFFYFSSVKAVADTVVGTLDENVSPKPFTPYGQSKLEAEQFLLKQELPAGKRLFIIRPCMIHGPGNKGNLNLLYKVVQKSIPWPLAAFDNQRSFLFIDNLSWMLSKMLSNQSLKGGVFNFADDKAISTNELVSIIAAALGKKPKLWRISVGLMQKMAKLGDTFKLPLNSERLKKLTESYVVSNQKIKSALGIEALPINSAEGLKRTILAFSQTA